MVRPFTKFSLFQFFGWGFFALLNTYIALLTQELDRAVLIINILLSLGGILLTTGFRQVVVSRRWHRKPTEQIMTRVIPSVALMALCYTVWYFLLICVFFPESLEHTGIRDILGSWVSSAVLLSVWTLLYFIWHYVESSRAGLIKRLQLESSMKDMEIKTMRSNLQPHFIFNSLNSIRALIDEDPELARLAITKISNILRNSITKQEASDTLENELQLAYDYLDLEKIRFEERLTVSTEIDPETLNVQIPTMMIQTLVENAVKHGISKREAGGQIHIRSKREGATLTIEIANTGTLLQDATHEHSLGFGLSSSRQRLQHLYGEQATLLIFQRDDQVVLQIHIQLKPQ